jgi:hypothetical protein
MDYLSLKHFHMGCAALSGALFACIVTVATTRRTFT